MVVAESYSIIEVTTTLFVVIGRHDCLWSKVLKVTDDYIICEHSHSSSGSMTAMLLFQCMPQVLQLCSHMRQLTSSGIISKPTIRHISLPQWEQLSCQYLCRMVLIKTINLILPLHRSMDSNNENVPSDTTYY